MENFNEDLDKEEFVDSSFALLEKLDHHARNQILNFGRKVPRAHSYIDKNITHHPKISEKSR